MRRPDISPEEFLEHYGVKGMKWGVRKDRNSRSRGTSLSRGEWGTKKTYGSYATKTAAKRQARLITKDRRPKNIDNMSDADLISRTNRLKMENRVKKLGRDFGGNRYTRRNARRLFANKESFTDKQLSERLGRLERERLYNMELNKATKPTRTAIRNIILGVSDAPVKSATGTSPTDVWNTYEKTVRRYGYQG